MSLLSSRTEVRLFQTAVLAAALVPIAAGAAGAWGGPEILRGVKVAGPDLESHFRYLSGLLLAIGIGFAFAVLDLNRRAIVLRTLGMVVIAGGLARLVGAIKLGLPGGPHLFALIMELVVVPVVLLWLNRIERLYDGPPSRTKAEHPMKRLRSPSK